MGLLVFQESAGETINVQGTNTSSTITWTIPATSDTFVGLTSSYTEVIPLLVAAIQEISSKLKSANITGF